MNTLSREAGADKLKLLNRQTIRQQKVDCLGKQVDVATVKSQNAVLLYSSFQHRTTSGITRRKEWFFLYNKDTLSRKFNH